MVLDDHSSLQTGTCPGPPPTKEPPPTSRDRRGRTGLLYTPTSTDPKAAFHMAGFEALVSDPLSSEDEFIGGKPRRTGFDPELTSTKSRSNSWSCYRRTDVSPRSGPGVNRSGRDRRPTSPGSTRFARSAVSATGRNRLRGGEAAVLEVVPRSSGSARFRRGCFFAERSSKNEAKHGKTS